MGRIAFALILFGWVFSVRSGRIITGNPSKRLIFALSVFLVYVMPIYGAEIHDAVKKGNLDKVKSMLVEKPELVNAKEDTYGETPLHEAASKSHKDVSSF